MNLSTPLRVCALLFASAEVEAQVPAQTASDASERVVYEAAFYSQFVPRTALDMINQTPGFTLEGDEEDEQRRGFSGAVGNVLIDGERLSAKSQSLTDVLSRVSAAEVTRIEILRGSEVAGDASGAAVLANVVRTRTAGGGSWEAGFEITNERRPTPTGRFAWSGRNGETEYSIGANAYTHEHDNGGSRIERASDGELVAAGDTDIPHKSGDYALNGQVATRLGGGKLTLTGQAASIHYHEEFGLLRSRPAGAAVSNQFDPFTQDTRTYEAGATFQRAVSGWQMDLNALATRKQLGYTARSGYFDLVADLQSDSAQYVNQDSGETILRGTFTRDLAAARVEFGAEIAVNTLDGKQSLTYDNGSGPLPVDLPNANLSVEENRAEAFVSGAWQLGGLWSLDSRLAAETSRLSFTGDTEQAVTLTYVKPRVQVTRKLGPHRLQVRVYRDVGQLDFTDFVSTAQLTDGVVNGGNPDLKPQTAWALEADADLRFSDEAALRVRVFHHWLDDVVDLTAVGAPENRSDAPGNIGSGKLSGVELSTRVPLGRLLTGGSLNIAGTWQDSSVRDPLTGELRAPGDFVERKMDIELRQDLNAARLAWGVSFHGMSAATEYRLSETSRFRHVRQTDAFIETTAIAGVTLRLEALSLFGDTEKRLRRFYSPDRRGALAASETSFFRPGRWWMVSAAASF